MEYKKIRNLLDNTTNQPSKFRTRNWVKINDELLEKYDSSCIKFKTLMIRLDLCDYSDAYMLVSRTLTINEAGEDDIAKRIDEKNKRVIF